ncbi:MAG TPA: hypothetical protein VG297_02900 [Bryobacteraceae bacterium]|jgi:hypothetical protein|nr:hypothetical protein [Bryobacteraceae bacterium]
MAVHIKIDSGKSAVTISVSTVPDSGGASAAGDLGTVTQEHNLLATDAGSGATASTSSGGGAPGSGVLVIGPIVVPCANSAGAGDAGGGATASTSSGGGATASTSSGGAAAPGSGVLVIGPIVIGGATAKNPAATQEITTTPVVTTPVTPEKS